MAVMQATFRVALTSLLPNSPQLLNFRDASDVEANHNDAAMAPSTSSQRIELLRMPRTVSGP
jgi:hypothetical protein